jgi:hypothetical protein
MTTTESQLYLMNRAANEGITVDELMEMTPTSVSDDSQQAATFWQGRDYSHIAAVATNPDLADDPTNAMPEHMTPNRGRGASMMTTDEQSAAEIDNEIWAAHVDAGTPDTYQYDPDASWFDVYLPYVEPTPIDVFIAPLAI